MGLFCLGKFKLNSGLGSPWKIDCDHLTDSDISTGAHMISALIGDFGRVEGIPSGGLRLARAMEKYAKKESNLLLIVDDVFTTGGSMERHRGGRPAKGAVIFSRGACPAWVQPLFQINPRLLKKQL
jgi:orotate phosphoribosyltransferase